VNIAICDDLEQHQLEMKKIIRDLETDEKLRLCVFSSGEELLEAYEKNQRFSIILLDMQMKKLDGIQTAKVVREYDKDCIIIIVTSILEYAVEGYGINAFDFVLKSAVSEKLKDVLLKAIRNIKMYHNQSYLIQTRDKVAGVKLSEILYFESNGKKVIVNCDDKTLVNNESISVAQKKLISNGFIRVSRYYLVNMYHLKEIRVKSLVLSNGEVLNYSSKLKSELKEKYMEYMMEDIR